MNQKRPADRPAQGEAARMDDDGSLADLHLTVDFLLTMERHARGMLRVLERERKAAQNKMRQHRGA